MKSIKNPILIVDDDEDDHYLLKRVCEKLGITAELVFFTNGKEVLEYLRTPGNKPFIILCDINMPIMGGLELRKHINEDESLRKKNIPFIFFSTAAMPSIVKDAYDLTIQGFFLKEQSLEKLEKTLGLIFEYWRKCKYPNSDNM